MGDEAYDATQSPEAITDELGEHYALAWPDRSRKAFAAGEWGESALVGQIRDGGEGQARYHYQRAYEEAVEVLHSHAASSVLRPEHALLPLGFLWRHLLEVSLKDLIRVSRELFFEELSRAETIAMRSHNLKELWQLAKPHVALIGDTDSPPCSVAEEILLEMHDVDPTADGFRYPFRRDGETQNLMNAPHEVDIRNMHETFKGVFNFLGGCMSEVTSRDDLFAEYESEMAAEYGPPSKASLGEARRAYCAAQVLTRTPSADANRAERSGSVRDDSGSS